ncbi:MAG TPA: pyrroline-5-carboxylate reductase [Xanthobacteraceae bacterium]|nr:pyrroline-5-carboxylate reductase [Xanthobacteraceae bacterium]
MEQASLSNFDGTVVLVGAGKMGGALLEGWHRLGLKFDNVVAIEPQPSAEIITLGERGLRINPALDTIAARAIVIAVKPQVAAEVVPTLGRLVRDDTVAISIMAGRTLALLEKALPAHTAVVRAMPNTPAAIGRGITVAVPNARVNTAQRELTDKLLRAAGAVEWIDDETLMDAVTAVSGSGPAYVFLLAESLARAGAAAGLPAELAARLARATVAGAGELMHRSNLDAATLRQNVTSPGGTTAAALAVLMAKDGIDPIMRHAVAAATRRGRELAG